MRKLAELVIENTLTGKIAKETAIEILKLLKTGRPVPVNDIAVIGMAGRFPQAENIEEYWENIRSGIDCIGAFPDLRRDDSDGLRKYTRLGGGKSSYYPGGYLKEIDKFDYAFFKLSPKEANLMDPSQRLFLEIGWEALEDGGYGGKRIMNTRTGVYVGYNNWPIYGQIVAALAPEFTGDVMVGNLASIIPARISYLLDLHGPAILVDTACSSSLVAVHMACQAIKAGECEMALAGGVNIRLFPLMGEGDIGTSSPDYRTKSFDEASDGTSWGEGVAAVLLKPLNKALADGDNVHAIIKGSAMNHDGYSIGLTAPNAIAQEDMLIRAWEAAGVDPETISYLEAHGTATPLGDPVEVDGIRRGFQRFTGKKGFCAIGSVKSNIGHLDSVSGVAGLIKVVLALKHQEIPPTLHFNLPNSKINFMESPVYVNSEPAPWERETSPRRCGVNSFGLSGTNCHVVLEEASPSLGAREGRPEVSEETPLHVFTISAKSESAFWDLVRRYQGALGNLKGVALQDLCFTANTGRGHYNYRLAALIRDEADFQAKIGAIVPGQVASLPVTGVYYGWYKTTPKHKANREVWEVTETELQELDRQAAAAMETDSSDGCAAAEQLHQVCALYVKGATVDWSRLYGRGRVIPLPVYPFERKRCWIELPPEPAGDLAEMFFDTGWQPRAIDSNNNPLQYGALLLLSNDSPLGNEITAGLRAEGRTVIAAGLGPGYQKITDHQYTINGAITDYISLLADIQPLGVTQIVHLFTATDDQNPETYEELELALERGVYNLCHLLKALGEIDIKDNLELLIVTAGIADVTGTEAIHPENGVMAGLGKVVNLENLYLKCHCLDIDHQDAAPQIIAELKSSYDKFQVTYRNRQRYIEEFQQVDFGKLETDAIPLKQDGIYLITGGTGGIGLEVANYLASRAPINLGLLSRSGLPERAQWDEILNHGQDDPMKERLRSIGRLEQNGARVILVTADVSNQAELEPALQRLRTEFGRINGVIHCAGIIGDGFVINKEEKTFRKVLAPKVYGAWLLDQATRADKPDFFFLFSSGTSMLAEAGQGDYMAANAYLDSFAAWQKRRNQRAMTINWTQWKETGMAKNLGINVDATFRSMLTSHAMNAFQGIFEKKITHVLIGELNYDNEKIFDLSLMQLPFNLGLNLVTTLNLRKGFPGHGKLQKPQGESQTRLMGRNDGRYPELEKEMGQVWGQVLGMDEISIDDNFYELGGNSIKAVQILVRLKNYRLNMKDLFQYPSIRALSEHIQSEIIPPNARTHAESSAASPGLGIILSSGYNGTDILDYQASAALEAMKPFNEVYYIDCFYNAFFPVLEYFGKDLQPFLINDIAQYAFPKTKNTRIPEIEFAAQKTIDQLLHETGLLAETKFYSDNLILDLVTAISRDRPAIIRVDSFYESIRFDTYNQSHWPHWLLVYGYDRPGRAGRIMEHENLNSLSYKRKTLSFDELIASYNGYLSNFDNGEAVTTYYEFSLNPSLPDEDPHKEEAYRATFAANMLGCRDYISSGLECLNIFREDFERRMLDPSALTANLEELVFFLGEALKLKSAEKYKIMKLYDPCPPELLEKLERTSQDWSLIKSVLEKYRLTKQYRPAAFRALISNFEQGLKAEMDYYNLLFSFLK